MVGVINRAINFASQHFSVRKYQHVGYAGLLHIIHPWYIDYGLTELSFLKMRSSELQGKWIWYRRKWSGFRGTASKAALKALGKSQEVQPRMAHIRNGHVSNTSTKRYRPTHINGFSRVYFSPMRLYTTVDSQDFSRGWNGIRCRNWRRVITPCHRIEAVSNSVHSRCSMISVPDALHNWWLTLHF
jgi:hypothetical protein